MICAYGDRILVQEVERKNIESGLILPEERHPYKIGKIVSIGSGMPDWCYPGEEDAVAIGKFVWFSQYAGHLVEFDDVQYVSLETKDILAFSAELK